MASLVVLWVDQRRLLFRGRGWLGLGLGWRFFRRSCAVCALYTTSSDGRPRACSPSPPPPQRGVWFCSSTTHAMSPHVARRRVNAGGRHDEIYSRTILSFFGPSPMTIAAPTISSLCPPLVVAVTLPGKGREGSCYLDSTPSQPTDCNTHCRRPTQPRSLATHHSTTPLLNPRT